MYKKFLAAFLLAGSLGLTAIAKDFSDLGQTHWAYDEIKTLAEDNVVVGYPDGTFRPDDSATRAEFVTMVIKALWQEHSKPDEIFYYKDVLMDHWAYEMVQIATTFDLLKTKSGDFFRPEDNIIRKEAISIVINSVDAGEMTQTEAVNILSKYNDINRAASSEFLPLGKAEKFGLIATPTEIKDKLRPGENISRAEIAYTLYNMRKQALINPSKKLEVAFKPVIASGKVIPEAWMEENGIFAHIPAGTVIEVELLDNLNSQEAKIGEMFKVKTTDAYVTRENYLLFPEGATIFGEVQGVKKARYFVRNADMDLDSKRVCLHTQPTNLKGDIDFTLEKENWFVRTVRYVIKGRKTKLEENDILSLKLLKPIKIDVTKTMIVE